MPKYPLERKNESKKIIVHLPMDEKFKNSVVTALSTPKTNKLTEKAVKVDCRAN